jgi:hypothetical protein
MKIASVLLIAVLLVSSAGCASAPTTASRAAPAADGPLRYVCRPATSPIVVDGRLDEPAWRDAAWTAFFVDIEGDARPRPRYRTRARMTWDDEAFYVAAGMEEPHVWGVLTEHDSIVYHDNDFEVFIDPDGDRRNYYEVEVNALNTIFDLLLVRTYIDGGPARHEWELEGLETAIDVRGTLNDPSDLDRGWTCEIRMPWAALAEYTTAACPPAPGDVWRVNFSRVQWRHRIEDGRYEKVPDTREDNWVWSPQGVINMHVPEHWGFVEFAGR